MQAKPDLMQFRFTHDAGQAEQQTVMIGTRVEQPLAIGDQHAEQRAQFQQLMPVAIVARQARGVEADDQAGMAEADLGDQLLEAMTFGVPAPDLPRSSSMTWIRSRGQPRLRRDRPDGIAARCSPDAA